MSNNIVSKKIAYAETGVFGPNIIEAEIGLLEDRKNRFIRCEWCGEDEYSLSFEVTTESLFDHMVNMDGIEDIERIQAKSAKELGNFSIFRKYKNECQELKEMVEKFIRQSEIYDDEEVDDFVSEWPEIKK